MRAWSAMAASALGRSHRPAASRSVVSGGTWAARGGRWAQFASGVVDHDESWSRRDAQSPSTVCAHAQGPTEASHASRGVL